jgi:hypothetical protein
MVNTLKETLDVEYRKSVYNAGLGKKPSVLKHKHEGKWYYYVNTPKTVKANKIIRDAWTSNGYDLIVAETGLFYVRRK